MSTPLLDAQHIGKTYGRNANEVCALEDVTVSGDPGEFIAVQGPSGSGKTTFLLVAGGLLAPDSGEICVDGVNPYSLTSEERACFRAKTVGFVFQQFHLVPYLSVLDNVLAPAMASGLSDARDRARELIVRFGMEHRTHHVPAQLSTGERQRTALARALLNSPKLLLADEPTGNLDRENAEIVLGYLTDFVEAGGIVLLVTHSDHAASYAQHLVRLRDGRVLPTDGGETLDDSGQKS